MRVRHEVANVLDDAVPLRSLHQDAHVRRPWLLQAHKVRVADDDPDVSLDKDLDDSLVSLRHDVLGVLTRRQKLFK